MTTGGIAAAIVTAGLVLATLGGWFRTVRPRLRSARRRWTQFEGAVIGREAVLHPDTGEVIVPAQPGIGARQANIEAQMHILTDAVAKIADSHARIDDLERRVTAIEAGHHLERLAGKAEAIQLYSTLEAVAMADPPDDPTKEPNPHDPDRP